MTRNPMLSVLFLIENELGSLKSFLAYLGSMPHVRLSVKPQLPRDMRAYDVVVTFNTPNLQPSVDYLTQFVRAGSGWLTLVHLSELPLPPIFGIQPEPIGPVAELRVLFENAGHPLAARLPPAVYLQGCYQPLSKTEEDTETILYADWHYRHTTVLAHRTVGEGRVAGTTLQDYADPTLQQIYYRLLYRLAGQQSAGGPLGIGLLGYPPSVGPTHGLGAAKTPGLDLRAVCDLSPDRIGQALKDYPSVKPYESATALAEDPDVDLVIVATAPNTHTRLCLQMMAAGKHVVCEKPLALNREETDALLEMADKQNVHLSCHQNRRWDPDYLSIQQAVNDGQIGDLFYMETFVGGFQHPCGYWHSHAAISGGTSYDWGAHYLDWIVSLLPQPIEAVVGTRHKRVWHDVTNADQERIQIRFKGGQEAEFMHSDMAAARKPKWYLLGTHGAIVGHWQDVTSYEIDPIFYYQRHEIPATELTPVLTVFRRHPGGKIIRINPAIADRKPYGFHCNLADHLLMGEPITAPLDDSVKVVAILEAAARSMANGGTVEVVNAGSN